MGPEIVLPTFTRRGSFAAVLLLLAAVAGTDWLIGPNVALGFLYFVPILVAGKFLQWPEIAGCACAGTVLAELFGPAAWEGNFMPRLAMRLIALLGTGLLIREIELRRRFTTQHQTALAEQTALCEKAEQQLRSLVEGTPSGILTTDSEGRVLMANEAAHEILGCEDQSLAGQSIDAFLPAVAELRRTSGSGHVIRTSVECPGFRRGGEAFLAQAWLSSFGHGDGQGLTVILFDCSDQLRGREEGEMRRLTSSARVILGSFWHETRNLCTAMRLTADRLESIPGVAESEENATLRSLIEGLEKLAVSELLQEGAAPTEDCTSLRVALDHLRIVVEPWLQESKIEARWSLADNLPLIRGDQHAVLQVFLNLIRNAQRALEGTERKELAVNASVEGNKILVRFSNNGPPVDNPDALFRPFQPEAAGRGIGLYVSRALVRSFGGDLRYEPDPGGACFTVVLERGATWYMFKNQ